MTATMSILEELYCLISIIFIYPSDMARPRTGFKAILSLSPQECANFAWRLATAMHVAGLQT